jgi:hypothetical protein
VRTMPLQIEVIEFLQYGQLGQRGCLGILRSFYHNGGSKGILPLLPQHRDVKTRTRKRETQVTENP